MKPEPGTEQIPSVQQIQWFYLDPQGNEQGPFTSSDMLEWYEARYFPADLMLRRAGIDRRFTALNEISMLYGRVPFTPGPAPGPLLPEPQKPLSTPTPPPPQQQPQPPQQPSPSENSNQQQTILQHMQQQMLQQQLLRQQQQLIAIQQQTHLSELEKAQLINKVMQLSLLPQQQQQQKPSSSSSAGDISMLLKQHEQQVPNQQQQMHHHQQQDNHHQQQMMQQQQQHHQQQFGNFNMGMKPMESPQHQGMQPIMNSSSAESGLQLLGNLNGPNANEEPPFNPIKSLLRQLQEQDQQPQAPSESLPSPQQESHHSEAQDQPRAPSNISGFMNQESPSPPPLQHQSPQAPRSIWGDQKSANQQIEQQHKNNSGLGVWGEETARESPNSFYNQVQQQREVGINNESPAGLDQDGDQDISGFVKPRASEKKDKKAKKAEEKKRAREKEAKRNAGSVNDYIPGMEGSVRPTNDSEEETTQQRQYVGPFLTLFVLSNISHFCPFF